jgi:putative sugar O-methyltransferase
MNDFANLMAEMVAASDQGPEIFRPGPYWKPHADSMIDLVAREGIDGFRSISHKALLAFATGSVWKPRRSANPTLWRIHEAALHLPLLSKVAAAYQREIDTAYSRARGEAHQKLLAIYALLGEMAPDLLELSDGMTGRPAAFDIDGRQYSEMFLYKLLDLALLRRHVDLESCRLVCEIGGSYGLFGEILLKRYPKMKYALLDLAPVSAFGEYYLEQAFPGQVMGFRRTSACERIPVEDPAWRAFVVCAHQLETLGVPIDLFVNCGSFQEMTREQVSVYAEFANRHSSRAYINNRHLEKPMGHGFEFYRQAMQPMRLEAEWKNPMHQGYHPALFLRNVG